eukprot:7454228-Heterocapsa_arctica.AAC.1
MSVEAPVSRIEASVSRIGASVSRIVLVLHVIECLHARSADVDACCAPMPCPSPDRRRSPAPI